MGDQNNNIFEQKREDESRAYEESKSRKFFGGGFTDQMRQYGADYNSDREGFMGNSILRGDSGKIGSGWLRGKNSTWVIVIVLVIVIIYTFYSQNMINSNITKSTIERTKIESVEFDASKDKFYDDEISIVEDDSSLKTAADKFYDSTGVIPYIKFLSNDTVYDNDQLTVLAEAFYIDTFTDDDHLAVFFQPNGTYGTAGYAAGGNAKKVMDSEAIQIFNDYLMKFYDERQSNNQTFMTNTLNYASQRIMTTAEYSPSTIIFGIIILVILVAVIIYGIVKKQKEDEAEAENSPENRRIETDDHTISRRANQNVDK